MVPFLVMQYSMDEKNDKQGGAFNKGSGDITEKWTEANILASSYQKGGCSLARSSHSEYPMAQTICIGLLYFSMLINILCFKPLIHMILNISFRYHINIWGVIYIILINQSEFPFKHHPGHHQNYATHYKGDLILYTKCVNNSDLTPYTLCKKCNSPPSHCQPLSSLTLY